MGYILGLPSTTDSGHAGGEDRFASAPISRLVGFEVMPGEPGEAVVAVECNERLHNPMGRVHGGVLSALADAAMGIAFGRTLGPGQDFSTIEMQVHFIRPWKKGRLEARATVRQRGLRIGFVQCDILAPSGKLIATATSTCTVVADT